MPIQSIQNSKWNKKEFILLGAGIIIIGCSVYLIIFSLTFLIKNINLIFKPQVDSFDEIHFNLSGAEKLFPNLLDDKKDNTISTSTLP